MVYNFPFFMCELNYSVNFSERACMDVDYGVGMTLRSWMLSSAIIGLAMYVLQLVVVVWKLCLPERKKLP